MTAPDRLKIVYLCAEDPRDAWSYSGGNARLYELVRTHLGEVVSIEGGWHGLGFLRRLVRRLPERIWLRLDWRLRIVLGRLIGWQLSRRLAGLDYDVLFCTYGFQALSGVRPPDGTLTVFTSDAVPSVYRSSAVGRSFGSAVQASRRLDRYFDAAEGEVLRRTDLMLWPSAWLKDGVDARHGLDDAASVLVPWGANVAPPDRDGLVLGRPVGDPVRLLLVGRDWFAKGGPLAFETMMQLRGEGVDARLTVIGCTPPDFHVNEHVEVTGFLDRTQPEQLQRFTGLYASADFMVMPSYESYGFAFCEASAYGLPSLCLSVGGVPVVDGVNGHALPEGADAAAFAAWIRHYREDRHAYAALRASAREYYETALNWEAWAARTRVLIGDRLAEKRASTV